VVRAKLFGQWFLVVTACDRDNFQPHLGSKLSTEVAEAADPEYPDEVPRPRD